MDFLSISAKKKKKEHFNILTSSSSLALTKLDTYINSMKNYLLCIHCTALCKVLSNMVPTFSEAAACQRRGRWCPRKILQLLWLSKRHGCTVKRVPSHCWCLISHMWVRTCILFLGDHHAMTVKDTFIEREVSGKEVSRRALEREMWVTRRILGK